MFFPSYLLSSLLPLLVSTFLYAYTSFNLMSRINYRYNLFTGWRQKVAFHFWSFQSFISFPLQRSHLSYQDRPVDMRLQFNQQAILDVLVPSQSIQRNVTNVFTLCYADVPTNCGKQAILCLLSLCKIFTSRQKTFLSAQQQTCPIINCIHSTHFPGKNTSVTKLNLPADVLWEVISD